MKKSVRKRILVNIAVSIVLGAAAIMMACDNAANTNGEKSNTPPPTTFTDEDFIYNDGTEPQLSFTTNKSGDKELPFLSKDAIKERLAKTAPSLIDDNVSKLMVEPVSYTAPYSIGKADPNALRLALERANVFRRIAGLHPVTLDENLTTAAQKGAALMAITGVSGHGEQPKPEGMDNDLYSAGIAATTKCNLATNSSLVDTIGTFIDDHGGTDDIHANAKVGHRMKFLDHRLISLGFGIAPANPKGGINATLANYSNLPNAKHPDMGSWDFVAWPAPGYFPLKAGVFDRYPSLLPRWSVTLNREAYPFIISQPNQAKVVITHVNAPDGEKTWTYYPSEPNMYIGVSEIVFPDSSNGGYKPEPYMSYVFFINDPTHRYNDGDIYKIELTTPKGETISYTTEFFDATK